jgi:rRNA maturation endonuclease Nob1
MNIPVSIKEIYMSSFQCFNCHRVIPFVDADTKKCPSCGSEHGQFIDDKRLKEGLDSGEIFNIDPKTGKPAKKKK